MLALMSGSVFAATLTVTASPSSVSTAGTSTLKASGGSVVVGSTVNFAGTLGGTPFSASAAAVLVGGVPTATIIYTAGAIAGVDVITATFTADSGTATIVVNKANLEVDISVSLAIAIDVTFADGSVVKSWTLNNVTLGSAFDTAANPNIDIKNNGGAQTSLTIQVTDPTSGNWASAAAAGQNNFAITPTPVTTPAILKAADNAVAYEILSPAGSAGNTSTTNNIHLVLPTSVTHTSPGAGAAGIIKVLFAATLTP